MENTIDHIRDQVRELIEELTGKLPDSEYIEVLEEIEADVAGMIDAKKEESGE